MLKIKVREFNNFSNEQSDKMFEAMDLFESAINSSFFKKKVIEHTFRNKKRFLYNNGLTNVQIFNSIMAGRETLQPIVDYEADLFLNLDESPRHGRTIGYTNKETNQIFTYETWFDDKPVYEYSGHVAHEWCHKIGFDHQRYPSKRRLYTVPYAIGYLIREISSSLYFNLTNKNVLNHEN